MSADRISWKIVNQACAEWADAARAVNYPKVPGTGWELRCQSGSVNMGHASELYWVGPSGDVHSGLSTPGGRREYFRSAVDTYTYIVASTATLRHLAAQTRKQNRK